MPAPARISVPVKQTTPMRTSSSIVPKSPESIARPKARVVHRRRARARLDDTDTDEDLVREPRSDDDTDSASSILDTESETVSDFEQEQEPTRAPSPSHTPLVNGTVASPSPPPPTEESAAFPSSVNWSEMVADENANGAADLPIIDFADLSSTQEPPGEPVSAPSPPPIEKQEESRHDSSVSDSQRRKPGQSVREAYRTRLDTDPAYVPTLGQFWSHDDRLLDKDLRSLSGWWRGRWQGRGRGRGFGGWGMRGRGRGGFVPGPGRSSQGGSKMQPPEDAPPVDRAWTHDGFEEMKKVEEEQGGPQAGHRGRGSFPRGRGGSYGGFTPRSEFAASPSLQSLPPPAPSESQFSSTSDPLLFGTGTRPWFAMKPERVWTKQFDAYLYFESALKPVHNQGLGQGVRIKLPGHNNQDSADIVVRLPPRMGGPSRPVVDTKVPYGDRGFVVNLPGGRRGGKERAHEDMQSLAPEDVFTVADLPMDDPVPVLPPRPIPQVSDRPAQDLQKFTSAGLSTEGSASSAQASVSQTPPEPPNDFVTAGPSQAAFPEPPQPVESFPPPPPPQLQASAPSFQPQPPSPYGGSPFGYGAPALPLPPGIAVSESGVTYEISTGRAVFLHTPPPPPPHPQMQGPLYNPRPMPMHHTHHGSVHFLPPPPQHVSISPPGFLASPPIFSLPRQSSRVEIRAPGEEKGKEPMRPGANANVEPFTPMGFYNAEPHTGFEEAQRHQQQQQQQQQHMAYQPTQYYYHLGPDGSAPYGYGQYPPVESQQYEQYPQDTYPQQQQHTGYY